MNKKSEKLLEKLLDLERSRQRERELRIESEAILKGQKRINEAKDTEELFQALVTVIHSVFDFEDAFILQARPGEKMVAIASTSKSIQGSTWPLLAVFNRVLAGRPSASFDVNKISEWANQPVSVRKGVKSALHIGLNNGQQMAILVVTHSSPRHFGTTQLKQIKRFAPLASQALSTLDLQRAVTQRDRFFQLSMIMMGIVDYHGYFKQFNTAWSAILGYSEEDIKKGSLFDFVDAGGGAKLIEILVKLKGTAEQRDIVQKFRCQNGSYCWLSCSLADYPDEGLCYIAARDVTERIMIERRLAHDARHDFLTGLFNRSELMVRLDNALICTARKPSYRFSLLYLDLDQFKIINDTLGHSIGDELLKEVSQRLLKSVREMDTVARIGGDEFAILLTDEEDPAGAISVAKRIHKLMSSPIILNGNEFDTSISIGISMSQIGYSDALSVMHDADLAMYAAKARGKSLTVVFHPELNKNK